MSAHVNGSSMQTLFSLIESPFHPDFSALYQKLGIAAERFNSARNLHRALQKQPPDFFVGEFIYGWGNNYAGANVSNLDVTIRSLQRFAPQAKIIVFMHHREEDHIGKLLELFPVHAVLTYPVTEQQMQAALSVTRQ
jgi:AmiR/NasT family two-component response regulator